MEEKAIPEFQLEGDHELFPRISRRDDGVA